MSRSVLSFPVLMAILILSFGYVVAPGAQAQSTGGQGTWSAKSPMPIKLSEVAVATTGGKIYAIGGATPEIEALRTNYEYDPNIKIESPVE